MILGLGRSPGGGHDNPLKYSYLENPMDRGASWATAHRVTESDTTEVPEHTLSLVLERKALVLQSKTKKKPSLLMIMVESHYV